MNFKSLYEIFHRFPLSCEITKIFTINRVLVGSGGSSNIILDVIDDIWSNNEAKRIRDRE